MGNYSMQIIWSDQKNSYVATVPELPQLTVIMPTAAQAVSALSEAITAYLKEKQINREPATPPRHLEEYSGQFRLRLPRMLHATLVREAEAEGISLNTYILYLLSERRIQQQTLKRVESVYSSHLAETIQYMHELVSNITVSNQSYSPSFSWQNDSSVTITQVQ
jgi:antitoxin HicB